MVLTSVAVAAAVACGGGSNSLGGSLSEVFPLDVSTAHVLRNDQALVVSYEANRGRDIDLVLRFTLALDQLPLQRGRTVKISGTTDAGILRATFLHNAAGEPARVLPPVSVGQFTLDTGRKPRRRHLRQLRRLLRHRRQLREWTRRVGTFPCHRDRRRLRRLDSLT